MCMLYIISDLIRISPIKTLIAVRIYIYDIFPKISSQWWCLLEQKKSWNQIDIIQILILPKECALQSLWVSRYITFPIVQITPIDESVSIIQEMVLASHKHIHCVLHSTVNDCNEEKIWFSSSIPSSSFSQQIAQIEKKFQINILRH